MSDSIDRVQENYKWTAYMKLKGQTWARKENEILSEFDGFVQSLRGIGVDYNIIVMVEGKAPRELRSSHRLRENHPKVSSRGGGA